MYNPLALPVKACCAVALGALLLLSLVTATAQDSDKNDKDSNVDVQLHVGKDANAQQTGLPLYPGARLKHDNDSDNSANFALLTGSFGMKLVVANYNSDDSADKVIAYYHKHLKKYGNVLECHTKDSGDVRMNDDKTSHGSNDLTCDGDKSGKVVELKAGTQDNQHIVSVEPSETGKGSTFAVVYLYKRGKRGDI
jgi:hypothetical protein